MVSSCVGERMLFAAKLVKLFDYLMLLLVRHSFVVVPVIGMPALSSKVLSVCFLQYISRSSHFWSCGFCKYSQASEKNRKHFVVRRTISGH